MDSDLIPLTYFHAAGATFLCDTLMKSILDKLCNYGDWDREFHCTDQKNVNLTQKKENVSETSAVNCVCSNVNTDQSLVLNVLLNADLFSIKS